MGWGYEDYAIKYWQGRDGSFTNSRGENARTAKLTEDQVREIKRLVQPDASGRRGVSDARLAARFGVGKTAIMRIRTGMTWSHVKLDEDESSGSSSGEESGS